MDFFERPRAANSAVHGRNRLKFELVRESMVVFLTCKDEEDPIKNESARVLVIFSQL